jgi:hypothetical protein
MTAAAIDGTMQAPPQPIQAEDSKWIAECEERLVQYDKRIAELEGELAVLRRLRRMAQGALEGAKYDEPGPDKAVPY